MTIDISNSIRLINNNGILICDDIWKTKPYDQDDTYHSIASYETLLALQNANVLSLKQSIKDWIKKIILTKNLGSLYNSKKFSND